MICKMRMAFAFYFLRQGICHITQAGLRNPCVAEDDLKLLTFLPLSPYCWDLGYAPPYPVYAVLESNPKISRVLGKHFTNFIPQALPFFFLLIYTFQQLEKNLKAENYFMSHDYM